MAYWLLKTEPDDYSWTDLAREKKTVWDGVANNTALKHIRTMAPGDLALIYHTADERQAMGIAEITSKAYADPKEEDGKLAVVDLKIRKKLARPVSLSEIKSDKAFAGWDLIRIGRLSVAPTPEAMWKRVIELSETPVGG